MRSRKTLLTKAVIIALALASSPAFTASFDCRKAQSTREKLVCSNTRLSRLDEVLATRYKKAIQVSNARPVLVDSQRSWLRAVDYCNNTDCLLEHYRSRIELLDSVAPHTAHTAQWNGTYHRYWKGKEDSDRASLTLIGLTENRVLIEGSTTWHGSASTDIRFGEIDDIGVALNQKLFFGDEDEYCSGELKLTNWGLEVVEETGCGGLNVTFRGQYLRNK